MSAASPATHIAQEPPYDAVAQDTDIATEIENFTSDVFRLKKDWEQAKITAQSLSAPAKADIEGPFKIYLQFIDVGQAAANDARASVLQSFVEKVVGSAQDPYCTLPEKLGEARNFLSVSIGYQHPRYVLISVIGLIQSISNSGTPKWTTKQTSGLTASLELALTQLKAYSKTMTSASIDNTELSHAMDNVSALMEKHSDLQAQIVSELEQESLIHKKLKSSLSLLLFLLVIAPTSFRQTLTRTLGPSDETSLLVKEDEKTMKEIVVAQKEVRRLKAAQKKQQGEIELVNNIIGLIQELIVSFKSVGPKLGQICVITDTVKGTVTPWIDFLNSPEAQDPSKLNDRADELGLASKMFDPISLALAGFVSRKI